MYAVALRSVEHCLQPYFTRNCVVGFQRNSKDSNGKSSVFREGNPRTSTDLRKFSVSRTVDPQVGLLTWQSGVPCL